MPRLIITTPSGEVRELNAETGITAMVAIRDAGLDGLLALCGGVCSCATCHVYVDPACRDMLEAVSADEEALLSGSSLHTENSRLSCQILLTEKLDGLRLTTAGEE
jgi:2Fe-2S ferredoxin